MIINAKCFNVETKRKNKDSGDFTEDLERMKESSTTDSDWPLPVSTEEISNKRKQQI